jgi:nitrite reductase/ring-hydroxylating ferredoxin subunit
VPGEGGFPVRLLVVRRAGEVFAYRNACPHRRLPLDYDDGRFLNADGTRIVCANHGALFRIEDGLCVAGPCIGAALTAIGVEIAAAGVSVWV